MYCNSTGKNVYTYQILADSSHWVEQYSINSFKRHDISTTMLFLYFLSKGGPTRKNDMLGVAWNI